MAVRRRRGLVSLLVGAVLLGAGGCSTIGRTIPPSGTGGGGTTVTTPSGSYGIVVSGTSAGLVRTVNLTLVVQ